MRKFFDLIFSNFLWYRDFCGGLWTKVRVRHLVHGVITEIWVRGPASLYDGAEEIATESHSYW